MKFSDTSSKTGLIQDCETLLGMEDGAISGNATLLKVFTRMINVWYRRVNSWIWNVTGTWEYDDSNWTDLPIATTDLITTPGSEQQKYVIPSTAQKVDRVEVKDSDGDYQLLTPIDKSQIKTSAMSEFQETAGMPIRYDLLGRVLVLYPKPKDDSVTKSAGLKLYFSRDIDEFVSTDTTKEPGFVRSFHRILSLGAAYDYAIGYEMNTKANFLKGQINELVEELQDFYSGRHRDMPARISPKRRNYT